MMPARSTNLIASFEMDDAIDAWASAPVRTKSTLLLLCLHLHDILGDIVVITRNMSIRISASRVPHVHIGQSNTGQTCVQRLQLVLLLEGSLPIIQLQVIFL